MSDVLQIVCPHDDAINRVPSTRLGEGPKCGQCLVRTSALLLASWFDDCIGIVHYVGSSRWSRIREFGCSVTLAAMACRGKAWCLTGRGGR